MAPIQSGRPLFRPAHSYLIPILRYSRAGLLDGFALAHGLSRIAGDVDYLTGERLIATPFLSAFQVRDILPLDLKRLRRLIATNEIGTLEIKVRGANVAPETLRRQLGLHGERAATLLVFGGKGPVRAVLAERVSPSPAGRAPR